MKNRKYLFLTLLVAFLIVFLAFHVISAIIEDDFAVSTTNNESSNTVVEFNNNEIGARLDNILINYDGKPVNVGNILCKGSKLYIPLNKFVKSAGGILVDDKEELSISLKQNVLFNIKGNVYSSSDDNIKLSSAFLYDENYYISIFDLCKSLSLFSDWDDNTKTISFISGYQIEQKKADDGSRQALIRLEDVAPMGDDAFDGDLFSQRVIADYLFSKGIPFSVSVVPRYINPSKGIDNDPSEKYSFYNAQFVFTLDYYIGRGGVIGAHGYTHQNGAGQSLYDKEFGKDVNLDIKAAQNRIENSVYAFEKMKVPVSFFSFPHYLYTPAELKIVKKHFDCIYQGYEDKVSYMWQGLNLVKLVPTPMNYVGTIAEADKFAQTIKSYSEKKLMSIFVHPYLEYQYIKINRANKLKPIITYDNNTVLHKVINSIMENGGKFVTIYDVNDKK